MKNSSIVCKSNHSLERIKVLSYRLKVCIVTTMFVLLSGCADQHSGFEIHLEKGSPQIDFACRDLKEALESQFKPSSKFRHKNYDIFLRVNRLNELSEEGFSIKKNEDLIEVVGFDEAGLMYACLELTEQIRLFGIDSITPTTQNPYLRMRGPKFNIPLDVRTPSYSDASDAGQKNIPVMWDFDFWTDYIDCLARYRYNYVSLWSLHPFPSLVKVSGYEKIALDSVLRSSGKWKERYNLNGIGMDAPEILDRPEVINTMSIDEKIDFWRRVMAYGKDRNIDFHIITWNIFDYGTKGQYGITDERENNITQDYFRKSVKQMFVTYPDLAGIGVTTGENIKGATANERENWAFNTYAQGIMDAAKEMPSRHFTFIHRQHQSGAREIAEKFKPIIEKENIEFLYCFKYAKAHVYSATSQPYHEKDNFVDEIGGLKTIWGLRNDDTYYFRWGAPDFVREFIRNMPHEVAKGIYFGSDQWIWGRDFLSKNPDPSIESEIDKHWYQWMLWGRLSFNPNIPNERFKSLLNDRLPTNSPVEFFDAWQNSSMIYPITTGFHWGRLDFQWYIEGSMSHPKPANTETGFHDVNRFITLGTHPKSGYQSIPEYVKMIISKKSSDLLSPLEVSSQLHQRADSALRSIQSIEYNGQREVEMTLHDIETVSYLGKYYGCKIAGATHLALYRETQDRNHQQKSIEELEMALVYWGKYVSMALEQNHNPLWTNRVGIVDWNRITDWVENDIAIAKEGSYYAN